MNKNYGFYMLCVLSATIALLNLIYAIIFIVDISLYFSQSIFNGEFHLAFMISLLCLNAVAVIAFGVFFLVKKKS